MPDTEKVTAQISPAVTGDGQSLSQEPKLSITDNPQENNDDFLYTITLTELYDTVFPPKKEIIEGILCSGAYLFAGSPKVGKSYFMLQLSYHVSKGIPLWGYPVHKGVVLYLALEDSYKRLQGRATKMFDMDNSDRFHLANRAKMLNVGLDGQLNWFIRKYPDTSLVIIDTLQKIRDYGGEKYSYAGDYEIVTRLKDFADKHNICVILVHHTRKQTADDSFDTISGTNGLLGAADGALILQKEKRVQNAAMLDIVGRDQQDQRLHLHFERARCLWQLSKAETELWKEPPDPMLEAIFDFLSADTPAWSGNASELIVLLNLSDIQPNVLTRRLNVSTDRLWNEYRIRYENSRIHAGRIIKLELDNSDGDDVTVVTVF